MYAVGDQIPCPFYFMATWHVFASQSAVGQKVLQRLGVFSVDREGTDLQAFREAVRILQHERQPLVVFPEGEIFHCNDRVTPFREGAGTIALTAARRAKRPIVCVPCAIKYRYVTDPTDELLTLMDRLEQQIHWRPRPDRPLPERIYAFGGALLGLKELEYLGQYQSGTLADRVRGLAEQILASLATRWDFRPEGHSIPEQIKELRRRILKQQADALKTALEPSSATAAPPDPPAAAVGANPSSKASRQTERDLEDLFLVNQLFSYPGDYVAQHPTVERIAETLDKFEEDVLHRKTAQIRGERQAIVQLGEPIEVASERRDRGSTTDLTNRLEAEIQHMLDRLNTADASA